MPGAWGTGQWGLGPWGGGGLGDPLTVVQAQATSTRTVSVLVSRAAVHVSALTPGDALNAATWTLTRLDTGQVFTIIGVRHIVDDAIFELATLEDLGPYEVEHRVLTTTLRAANGDTIGDPNYADFRGMGATERLDQSALIRKADVDLLNPFASDAQLQSTIQQEASGDYAVHGGTDLLKKLVLRRLLTVPGTFVHLPEYGIGLQPKEPLNSGDLSTLKVGIEAQLRREPELVEVAVRLSLNSNILTVRVQGKTRSGPVSVDIPIPVSL